jgi:hypothetical protein
VKVREADMFSLQSFYHLFIMRNSRTLTKCWILKNLKLGKSVGVENRSLLGVCLWINSKDRFEW